MSERPDEDGRLTSLLQALPMPEPSAEYLAGARRRYRDAMEARDRRPVSYTHLTLPTIYSV